MITWMVEFNFIDGKAMNIKMFDDGWKAEEFAEEHDGKAYEMQEVAR